MVMFTKHLLGQLSQQLPNVGLSFDTIQAPKVRIDDPRDEWTPDCADALQSAPAGESVRMPRGCPESAELAYQAVYFDRFEP